jgi:long-chain acyl-CoA synthetase
VNLATIIDEHPDGHTALVVADDRIGYGRLRAEVARVRAGLVGLGLAPGDRVGILCGTNDRFVRAWLGVLGAGLVGVPLNPQSPTAEISRELAVVGARAVIVGPAGLAAVEGLDRSALPDLEYVMVPAGTKFNDARDFDSLGDGLGEVPIVERGEGDLAALLFTSGTAGTPKAARLTHGNLASNLRQVQSHAGGAARPDDVALCVVPLFHILGLNSLLDLALMAGATLVLVERFDPVSLLGTIEEESVSVLAGPPTLWAALAEVEDPPLDALAGIRLAVSGAAPLPDRVASTVRERLGLNLTQGYGLTEASPSVTLGTGEDVPMGSIGRPIGGMEIRLVDQDGDDVLIGDAGEIWVRGPNVFDGYWDDPEATARAIDDAGWLHTGDLAVVDEHGYLFVVDRAKDLIIVSGFNVYPAEVEAVLVEHEAVGDVAVVGVAHPHSGETVKAFVVVEPGHSVEEDELIEWSATRLARYKCPTKIDMVDEIPRGMVGKILRRTLE